MNPVPFPTAADLRAWFEQRSAKEKELWIRLRKSGAAGPGVTYQEALDEALCFGWIDGVRHAFDEGSFATRFTPRKPDSKWSQVNLRHYERLERLGRIAPEGRAAFERRDPKASGYSFESRPRELPPALRRAFQANADAWAFVHPPFD